MRLIDMTISTLRRSPPRRDGPMSDSVASADLVDLTLREPMRDDEMTPGEVARELGVSPATVRRWEKRGTLVPSRRFPGSRHRRYSKEAVEALKKRMEAGGDEGTAGSGA